MKRKLGGYLLLFIMFCMNVSPSVAGDKSSKQAMSFEQIVSLLIAAQQSKEVVIVGLKGGSTVSGKIVGLHDEGFCIRHRLMEFFDDCTESISYADVVLVKKRNPVVKVLKRIGAVPVITVGYVVLTPYALYVAARGGM